LGNATIFSLGGRGPGGRVFNKRKSKKIAARPLVVPIKTVKSNRVFSVVQAFREVEKRFSDIPWVGKKKKFFESKRPKTYRGSKRGGGDNLVKEAVKTKGSWWE